MTFWIRTSHSEFMLRDDTVFTLDNMTLFLALEKGRGTRRGNLPTPQSPVRQRRYKALSWPLYMIVQRQHASG